MTPRLFVHGLPATAVIQMFNEKIIRERDLLLLYISDHFKELYGYEAERHGEGVPLEAAFVDGLLEQILKGSPQGTIHKYIYDHLASIWKGRKDDMEMHGLVDSHLTNMKQVVRNAKTISARAESNINGAAPEDMRGIQIFNEKRSMVREMFPH